MVIQEKNVRGTGGAELLMRIFAGLGNLNPFHARYNHAI
jgi:hypothetical protein